MNKQIRNNYIKLLLIIVVVVLLTVIICNLYKKYETNKLSKGYLSDKVSSIKYSELKNTLLELNGDVFLYFSYAGDKKVYNLEKGLEKIINENDIQEKFIYVDMKSLDDVDYKELNSILNINNHLISQIPTILYYSDGDPIEYISSAHGLIKASNFDQLLEKNSLGKYSND